MENLNSDLHLSNQKLQLKILIVDDEFLIRRSLLLLAQRRGHVVKAAEDGQSALEILKDFKPDVIFLDVLMPDQNGFSVLKKAKNMVQAKWIMISAHDNFNEETIYKSGADLFLKKPFDDILGIFQTIENEKFYFPRINS